MKSRCRQAFALLITAITVTLTGCSIFDKTANDEYISPSKQDLPNRLLQYENRVAYHK